MRMSFLGRGGRKAVPTQAVGFRLDPNLLAKQCKVQNLSSLSFLIWKIVIALTLTAQRPWDP